MQQQQAIPRLLLSVNETAQALGIGRDLVYALLSQKRIASIKVGRYRRIPLKALERYIEEQSDEEARQG